MLNDFEDLLDPSRFLRRSMGVDAVDPWQVDILSDSRNGEPLVAACCSRGMGKSNTAPSVAVDHALRFPNDARVVIASVSQRSAQELLRTTRDTFLRVEADAQFSKDNESEIIVSGARVRSIPATAGARGLRASLLIVDEMAMIDEDGEAVLIPMLKARGQCLALSSPGNKDSLFARWYFGKAGNAKTYTAPSCRITNAPARWTPYSASCSIGAPINARSP